MSMTTINYWEITPSDARRGIPFIRAHSKMELAVAEIQRIAMLWPMTPPSNDRQRKGTPWEYASLGYTDTIETRLKEGGRTITSLGDGSFLVEHLAQWRIVCNGVLNKTITGPDGEKYTRQVGTQEEIQPWENIPLTNKWGDDLDYCARMWFNVQPQELRINGEPEIVKSEEYTDQYTLEDLIRDFEAGRFDPHKWNWRVDYNAIPIEDEYVRCLGLYIMGSGASQCLHSFYWKPDSSLTPEKLIEKVEKRFGVKVLRGVG